jgi:intracellular septation protein A
MIGSAFVSINIATSIVPNEHLTLTTVFYLLNIIPFLAVDLLLSSFLNTSNKTIVYALSGAVLGLTFFMLYYPLIANIFNEVLPNEKPLWPSLTASTYFLLIGKIYPLVALPALLTGILGVLFASGLIQKTNQYFGLMAKRTYD